MANPVSSGPRRKKRQRDPTPRRNRLEPPRGRTPREQAEYGRTSRETLAGQPPARQPGLRDRVHQLDDGGKARKKQRAGDLVTHRVDSREQQEHKEPTEDGLTTMGTTYERAPRAGGGAALPPDGYFPDEAGDLRPNRSTASVARSPPVLPGLPPPVDRNDLYASGPRVASAAAGAGAAVSPLNFAIPKTKTKTKSVLVGVTMRERRESQKAAQGAHAAGRRHNAYVAGLEEEIARLKTKIVALEHENSELKRKNSKITRKHGKLTGFARKFSKKMKTSFTQASQQRAQLRRGASARRLRDDVTREVAFVSANRGSPRHAPPQAPMMPVIQERFLSARAGGAPPAYESAAKRDFEQLYASVAALEAKFAGMEREKVAMQQRQTEAREPNYPEMMMQHRTQAPAPAPPATIYPTQPQTERSVRLASDWRSASDVPPQLWTNNYQSSSVSSTPALSTPPKPSLRTEPASEMPHLQQFGGYTARR